MNNKENAQTNIINETYEEFSFLVSEGISMEEAFHSTVAEMLEDASEALLDVAFHISYKDGYIDAMRKVAEQSNNLADVLEDDEHLCNDCRIESEMKECGDCDCEDGCELDE